MKETHYVTYDPEKIYGEMQNAYMEAGGDPIYPGDEKEMLLRAVQAVMVQAFAGIDQGLRMATLRYAVGDYLDMYGQKRGCVRLEEAAAEATVEITLGASGEAKTIPAGLLLTADGEHLYKTLEPIYQTGYAQTIRVTIQAEQTGSAGNGLEKGTMMQALGSRDSIEKILCVKSAQGGQERENDESYRERIRVYGLTNVTTGPRAQYEAAAKNVSSQILSARARNAGAGNVEIVLLLDSTEGADGIREAVLEALNDQSVRPLTDRVTVRWAEPVEYTLKLQYAVDRGDNIADAVAAAVGDYQEWQDETIGRAFNPDRLMAAIYQAGAQRVRWGSGSVFGAGGSIGYTEIDDYQHCKGTITVEVAEL